MIFSTYRSIGKKTASAGTAIMAVVPAIPKMTAHLINVTYNCGATAHTLTLMKPLEPALELAEDIAGSGTGLELVAQPSSGNIANSDIVVIQLDNGDFHASLLSSVDGLTATVSALPSAASAGNKVWTFGATSEAGHSALTMVASKSHPENTYPQTGQTVLFSAGGVFQPLIVHSDNATNAGTIENLEAAYTMS